MPTIALSESAMRLLQRRLAGEWVENTEANRPLYRELVAAGLMEPIATFTTGLEGHYRLTEKACAPEVGARSIPVPALSTSSSPRG